jgi:hypothetical protein
MTQEEFTQLIENPDNLGAQHVDDLKQMIADYPYFVIPRLLLLKYYKVSESVHFHPFLTQTSVYVQDKRWLYYYLFPEERQGKPKQRKSKHVSGDYFEMMDKIESGGGDTKQSLKNLVSQLKSARELLSIESDTKKKEETPKDVQPSLEPKEELSVEELKVRELIREKKYLEALEILEALYFNNPKKSIYFADQIRFLRKVTENSK